MPGRRWMHVTDFDAIKGSNKNHDLVLSIIRGAGIPVQLGGGFRSRDRIEEWIDLGAGRIVVGTLAAQNPHLVKEIALRHPDQIVLAVDVWQGHVMIEGWKTKSSYSAEGFIDAFSDSPLAADHRHRCQLRPEGVGCGARRHLGHWRRGRNLRVIASGIVRTIDDISRLRLLGEVSGGAIVGRALFNKTLDLKEALKEARPDTSHVGGIHLTAFARLPGGTGLARLRPRRVSIPGLQTEWGSQ